MRFFSRDIRTMDELFVHDLRDIYHVERHNLHALSLFSEQATDPGLKAAFEHHLVETRNHLRRVELVFAMHDARTNLIDVPAIDGSAQENGEVAGRINDKRVFDAALIAAVQAVEHYEIARYGTLVSWCRLLGRNDCANVLQKNLEEAKAADHKLTNIAESKVNVEATLLA